MQEVDRILRAQGIAPVNGVAASGTVSTSESSSAAAEVEISDTAQDIQNAKQMVMQAPDVREDVVAAIKARIDNGTYAVSGEDIADLMIRRALADRIR